MRSYTVHTDAARPEDGAGLVLVREGFSWRALIFGWIWLVYRGLWMPLFGYVAVVVLTALVLQRLGLSEAGAGLACIGCQVILAFEGNDLRRWSLNQRGYQLVGTILAESEDAAERDYLRAATKAEPEPQTSMSETPERPTASVSSVGE